MKSLLIGLFITTSAFAAPFTYKCGVDWNVTVTGTDKKPVIKINYKTEKGTVVNILSDSEDDAGNDPALKVPNAIAFASFHYPSGDMYVIAEGDTNEEGFQFIVDEAMLKGAKRVKAATNFWSEWGSQDNNYDHFDCVRN